MQPQQGKSPTCSQIYIYDQEHELDYCMKPFQGLDSSLLLELEQMVKSVNPYAHKYLQVGKTLTANPACDIKLQTVQYVGIYLPDHVFTRGQPYVAFSRVQNPLAHTVYLNNADGITRNTVFQEVL